MLWLQVLNVAFFIFHTLLIALNLFGWAWKRARKYNLATLLLTAISWFVMGLWKGVGYCICTDWHWRVREALGIHETASSYVVLLTKTLTGWDPPVPLANSVAMVSFLTSLTLSILLNIRDYRINARLARANHPE